MIDKKRPGENLRRLRKSRKMSQLELAEAAGIHVTTLQKVEYGETSTHIDTIEAIAGALGVSVADIYEQRNPTATAKRRQHPDRQMNFESPSGRDVSLFVNKFLDISPDMRRVLVALAFDDLDLIPDHVLEGLDRFLHPDERKAE